MLKLILYSQLPGGSGVLENYRACTNEDIMSVIEAFLIKNKSLILQATYFEYADGKSDVAVVYFDAEAPIIRPVGM